MRIAVYVFFYLERFPIRFQVHTDTDVQCFVLIGKRFIVGILHVASTVLSPRFTVDILLDEVFIEVVHEVIFTLKINDRTFCALLINEDDGWYTHFLGHKSIVCTKVWSDMHDTCTILCGHIIARNYAEGTFTDRSYHRQQLFIVDVYKLRTFIVSDDAPRYNFISRVIRLKINIFSFLLEVCIQTRLC